MEATILHEEPCAGITSFDTDPFDGRDIIACADTEMLIYLDRA